MILNPCEGFISSKRLVTDCESSEEVWHFTSRGTLWDINQWLSRREANRIILESQFFNDPGTSFKKAALHTVAAARSLYGADAAATVTRAFRQRGIL